MPHPTKKQRLEGNRTTIDATDNDFVASLDDLSVDVMANILGFLSLKHIMCSRRINKKTMEAVKKTIVPLTKFCVDNEENYTAMRVMTRTMPNLQQITIHYHRGFLIGHKWSDGEVPDEEQAARTADWTTHDIRIISNFSKLRILEIRSYRGMNGRYPFLFNSFPLLQKLRLDYCHYLKWDLEMLAGFPLLKELYCDHNNRLTGDINSLSVLRDTLEKVTINYCRNVEGGLMDLADFPHLKELDLFGTAVKGDIRDIGDDDFSSLRFFKLPKGVYGCYGYELQRISDAPDLMRALYRLQKQRPALALSILGSWRGELSRDSPDWYGTEEGDTPPFYIDFVQAGSRIGYRWVTWNSSTCEVNWLDPEPDSEGSDYEKCIQELLFIANKANLYKGFYQPPTEEEYHRLLDT